MSTLTKAEQQKITDWLDEHPLSKGIGSKEAACSVAAINLALTGRLTDEVPECMSEVIGRWVIVTQDAMPAEIRNSPEWRALLPLAAGTGREYEAERLTVLLDHMWGTALPLVQPVADADGYGSAWARMCRERTVSSAESAESAARSAKSAESAARSAKSAARSASDAADSADSAAWSAWSAPSASPDPWTTLDPVGLLGRLIEVGA